MAREIWGFEQPDARVLKAWAREQRARPKPGLQITWPGFMNPTTRTYLVIPEDAISKPAVVAGEVILDSGNCFVLRRAQSPGEGTTDQVIFHNGRIDGERAEIICYNLTSFDIPAATIPAAPGEPDDEEDLYFAIQDNINGDFYITHKFIDVIALAKDLCKDLCAYWKFDESSGSALDSGPNKWNLQEVFGPIGSTTGSIGTARGITGSGQHFEAEHQDCYSIQQGGMFRLIFKVAGGGGSGGTIGSKSTTNPPGSGDEWVLTMDPATSPTHKLTLIVADGSGGTHSLTTDAGGFNDGSFHEVACGVTCENKLFIYADGVYKESAVVSGFADRNASIKLKIISLDDIPTPEILSSAVVDEGGIWACSKTKTQLDFMMGKTHPWGECCCDADAHTEPRATDRYSYNEIVAGETARVAPRRQMTVHGPFINNGTFLMEGQFVLEP